MSTPSDAELVGVVAGIVAHARLKFPKIDGWFVYVLAILASLAVCYVADPAAPKQALAVRVGKVVVGAVGGVSLMNYVIGKASVLLPQFSPSIPPVLAPANASVAPPPDGDTISPPPEKK